jgi:Pyruvate/2-oxoacid:ferredoxin oxidoreductase delta subunit
MHAHAYSTVDRSVCAVDPPCASTTVPLRVLHSTPSTIDIDAAHSPHRRTTIAHSHHARSRRHRVLMSAPQPLPRLHLPPAPSALPARTFHAAMSKKATKEEETLTRIAIVNSDKCKPKKCALECKRSCPVVRMGKMCIEVEVSSKVSYISEVLCIGCGICVKVREGVEERTGAMWVLETLGARYPVADC